MFRGRLRRLSEYGSVAYLVERPTWETRAEQYSDTVLGGMARAKELVAFEFLLGHAMRAICLADQIALIDASL